MRTTNVLSTPGFVADPGSLRHDTGRQINWPAVSEKFRLSAIAVTLTANAAQGATTLAVAALGKAVDIGATLDFGGAKFARTTAAAAAGATSVTVAAIPTALVTGDTAYTGGSGPKQIPAGTTVALPAGGKAVPAIDNTARGLLASAATEPLSGSSTGAGRTDALTGFGVIIGGHIYENLLPDAVAGDLPAAAKTALGALFTWQDLVDSRLP